jgi:hypothetical protein
MINSIALKSERYLKLIYDYIFTRHNTKHSKIF